MASQTSNPDRSIWDGPRVKHSDVAAALEVQRAKMVVVPAPRNAGGQRTSSKRALLKAIEDAGGKW